MRRSKHSDEADLGVGQARLLVSVILLWDLEWRRFVFIEEFFLIQLGLSFKPAQLMPSVKLRRRRT
jgi:hypothetical protein